MSPTASTDVSRQTLATSQGDAVAHIYEPWRRGRKTVVLGHGAGGGVESWDLQLLATHLRSCGHRVVLVEQPWRVAGRKVAVAPPALDRAWLEVVTQLRADSTIDGQLVVGGRSAGARVACRTAAELDAVGVLALAFPLHPPGRAERSRADELPLSVPTLVIQGSRDNMGTASEVRAVNAHVQVVEIPGANHGLTLPKSAVITQAEAGELIMQACLAWLPTLKLRESRPTSGR